jgi:hypothetical protein
MPDLRKRGPRGTVQHRAFLLLQRSHSANAGMVAAKLGTATEVARRAMLYLIERGHVRAHKYGPRRVIYAAVLGAKPPEDMRGKPAGSRNHRGEVARANILRRMPELRAAARAALADPDRAERVRESKRRSWAARKVRSCVLAMPAPVVRSDLVARVHFLGDD